MRIATVFLIVVVAVVGFVLCGVGAARAQPCCVMPDNGRGTADLPPLCPYLGHMQIIAGLPPGTTIQIQTQIIPVTLQNAGSGGTLGGTVQEWDGVITMTMTGTGLLAGFNRFININLPMCVTHSAPRVSFSPVQSFSEDLFRLEGQVFADPDFDLLRVTAGTDYLLPGPGHTTLTDIGGGNWQVDSFFDVTYRIDFIGTPGSPLQGMSGSTTGTERHEICPGTVSTEMSTWGRVKAIYR